MEIKDFDYTKFTFFWGTPSPFSNWHPAEFTYQGVSFKTSEQFMMYFKALTFNDMVMARAILAESDPRENKAQGRAIKGFEEDVWNHVARAIVYTGCRAKFSQNPVMMQELLSTHGTLLVEASPYDKIWGIGLGANDKRAQTIETWQGTNWLGEVLTQLREGFYYEAVTSLIMNPQLVDEVK